MVQIAKVIVDVPTMQTNSAYSYLIPTPLENELKIGMRVVVPFGNGNRKVQGFVVAVEMQVAPIQQLKEIDSLMDLEPVLNQELIQLSKWLASSTFSFQITCLLTMLPNVMRAKYSKQLKIVDKNYQRQDLAKILPESAWSTFEPDQLSKEQQSELSKLREQNKIEIVYQVKNQAQARQIFQITSQIDAEEETEILNSLRKNATKLRELVHFLAEQKDPINQPVLEKKLSVTVGTIKIGEAKGWLKRKKVEQYRDPYKEKQVQTKPLHLNGEQQTALTSITTSIKNRLAQTFLLEGVTGSGKTEVYLQAIAYALAQGKTAIMLVPEIALTPQMVTRVKGRFGKQVAVLHSGLSDGEKFDEWRRIKRHEAQVVVGARSAIFAPIENVGVIIIDEEHETSYKQDDTPRYHARDVAKWRSKFYNCPLVLGSATPSLESRARSERHVYQLLKLPDRINGHPLPKVKIIDMREELQSGADQNFSTPLLTAINQRLQTKQQSILMLNRRGYSSFIMCRDCGFVLKCPNCDISLTLHMDSHSMKCHYCGHEEPIPQICPNCHSRKIRYYGTGTEKVQQELQTQFPNARILRMDVDTTRRKGAHERILRQFGNHQADILLGTQMIAKGLDFPDVTLVGVLNADTALELPDFRASERTFQLLTQVSGRAGRAEKLGEVVIQTFNPDHYAIQLAKTQNYENFFRKEMYIRHQGKYPPYYFTLQITAAHKEEKMAAAKMYEVLNELRPYLSGTAIVLGPTPKPIARIKDKYYYQIVIKYKNEPKLHAAVTKILQESQSDYRKGVQLAIDAQPQSFM
ncbi:primosomal protein N' [Pediococcus cellicola]|uniref:Replication restart protein PriA n=1 Tax=Pediococcus cellicola TaxID=319652 RepID=A0A0R2J0J7_9LACO|nr:primosomal protein N' [Pediococcus cellicola]KRN67684.1 primosomal protein N [Pediococcus cellicola]GEL14326.1 primosomal protein N' [Pediococcus cellicola]